MICESKKIKIVHIISNLGWGGAQILLFEILTNLKKKENIDVHVITIDSGEQVNKYIESEINVIDLKEKGLINPKIFFKLKKILKGMKPDIVHTHLLKADFYGRIAAQQSGVQIIYSTIHTNSTSHRHKQSSSKSFFDCLDNFSIEFSKSNIIAISNFVRKYLIERKIKVGNGIEVIYNGIDIDKEKLKLTKSQAENFRQSLQIGKDDFVISIIGRLEESKGHLFFLDGAKDFLLSKKTKLLVIGRGSIRKKIVEFVEKNNLQEKIKLLDQRDDIEELIEISDLVAVPSLWEGFGLVIIEGMIKKTTVLGSSAGGIPDVINDGETGFLFRSQDSKHLMEKLNYIYEHQDKFDLIHSNALKVVKEKFDIEKNAELYYQSYIRIINKNSILN